jgi:hypothetical protein
MDTDSQGGAGQLDTTAVRTFTNEAVSKPLQRFASLTIIMRLHILAAFVINTICFLGTTVFGSYITSQFGTTLSPVQILRCGGGSILSSSSLLYASLTTPHTLDTHCSHVHFFRAVHEGCRVCSFDC